MAKINIERKRNVWPWIVALIVILLLAWGAYSLMDDRGGSGYLERPAATTSTPTTAPVTDPAASTTGDAARETPPEDDTTPPQQ